MKPRLILCGLWAVVTLILAHFVDPHFMLAGGGPCLIIINEGGRAYGAIEQYQDGGGVGPLDVLKAAVSASCALTSYGSTYKRIEGFELEGPVLGKIGEFHQNVIARIGSPDYSVAQEAARLERLNRKLANLIEPGTYPEV